MFFVGLMAFLRTLSINYVTTIIHVLRYCYLIRLWLAGGFGQITDEWSCPLLRHDTKLQMVVYLSTKNELNMLNEYIYLIPLYCDKIHSYLLYCFANSNNYIIQLYYTMQISELWNRFFMAANLEILFYPQTLRLPGL